MHKFHKLKDQLTEELEQLASEGGELSLSKLAKIDTLAHALKNLCKVMEAMDEPEGGSYRDGNYYRRNGADGTSNRRGSYREGTYRGYSRHEGKEALVQHLEDLLDSADTKSREAIERCISQVENA